MNDRIPEQRFTEIALRLNGAIDAGLSAVVIETGELFKLMQAAAVKWQRDKLMPIDAEAKTHKVIFVPALWTMRWLEYKTDKQKKQFGAEGRWQVITSQGKWIDCDFAPTKYSTDLFDI
jgi:hypothetical protein